jgi:2-keto-4-pentenoate hydratase/2-oxohepta-3-ene-1,7-dioic acid hydratase in catechol pathway
MVTTFTPGGSKPAHTSVCCFLCCTSLADPFAFRAPVLFYKPVTSLIGHLASVTIPKVAQPADKHLPDYEVELTIVIGKPAKDVSEEEALDYVLAYTGGNDVR